MLKNDQILHMKGLRHKFGTFADVFARVFFLLGDFIFSAVFEFRHYILNSQ